MKKKPIPCYIEIPVPVGSNLNKVKKAIAVALKSEGTDLLHCSDHLIIQIKFVNHVKDPGKD